MLKRRMPAASAAMFHTSSSSEGEDYDANATYNELENNLDFNKTNEFTSETPSKANTVDDIIE